MLVLVDEFFEAPMSIFSVNSCSISRSSGLSLPSPSLDVLRRADLPYLGIAQE
jgi:hypothetical protein